HLGESADVSWFPDIASGPTDETRDAMAAFPELGFSTAHSGRVVVLAHGAAVVGQENYDGVVDDPGFGEKAVELADVVVDVFDHREILDEIAALDRLQLGNRPRLFGCE